MYRERIAYIERERINQDSQENYNAEEIVHAQKAIVYELFP